MGQSLNLGTKIQISDLFFTIGEGSLYNSVGIIGNNNSIGEGYYKNHYREIHITKAYNDDNTMELYVFGFNNQNDAWNAKNNMSFTYQSAYGGNTKYPFISCIKGMEHDDIVWSPKGDGKSKQFPSNKWGTIIVDFGGINIWGSVCPPVTKKHNGIYTFKTTYKGKTYTSILHLKLSE
ncbi:hypothetical protein ACOTVC_06760 [Campylobacter sp. GB48]|uniref:hypothetical protein n=1 Tax=Campylobacter sp. GB48 TaxID=3400423 RepID=UPI003B99CB48